jgi:hypothetical protein
MVGDAVFDAITLSLKSARRTSHAACADRIDVVRFGLVFTVVITDIPGRSRFSRATENGTRIEPARAERPW